MDKEEFFSYTKYAIIESIIESILALNNDEQTISDYYGNPDKCTLESYFSSQIKGNSLYSQADEQSNETLLIKDYTEYKEIFDNAREQAYNYWLCIKNNNQE